MKKKINLYMFIVAVVAILSTLVLLTLTFQNIYVQRVKDNLKESCMILKETWNDDRSNGYKFGDLKLTVLSDDGDILYDTIDEADADIVNADEIISAKAIGEGFAVRKLIDTNEDAYFYALRADNGDIFRVSQQIGNIFIHFGNLMPLLVLILILMAAVCFIITKYLTADILKPIERMADNMNFSKDPEYKELVPIINMLKEQHENILNSARVRQEFSANVSHELKTPLTVISGYSELIENKMVSENDTVRFASEIHHNSDRLLTLINDIIRLSELDSESSEVIYEKVNLADVVSECLPVIQSNAKQHNINVYVKCEHCVVNGNRSMIEEIIMNLSNNATIYNRVGGSVWIWIYSEGGRSIISVRDDGIGIPKEHQERIFERFYRVDKSRSKRSGGTGLGLAIVKHIASSHNASISLKSEPNKGTEIKIIF